LRIGGPESWPKAIFNVAWGNAPGRNADSRFLAEGHLHPGGRNTVKMAFGQKGPNDNAVLGRLPQATVGIGLRPNRADARMRNFSACDSKPGSAPLMDDPLGKNSEFRTEMTEKLMTERYCG